MLGPSRTQKTLRQRKRVRKSSVAAAGAEQTRHLSPVHGIVRSSCLFRYDGVISNAGTMLENRSESRVSEGKREVTKKKLPGRLGRPGKNCPMG
jgi:hypothetical protein